MKGVGQVSLAIWVWEKQLDGRMGGVLVMKEVGRVILMVWAGEKQFDGRMGGGMRMRSAVLDSHSK